MSGAVKHLPTSYCARAIRQRHRSFGLHPALFDVATGFAPAIADEYTQNPGLHVPVSYGRLRVFGHLPAACTSHITLNSLGDGVSGLISFDVVVRDVGGDPVAIVEDFLMKRVDAESLADAEPATVGDYGSFLDFAARYGIEPAEGAGIMQMLLSDGATSSQIVSSIAWPSLVDVLKKRSADRAPKARASGNRVGPRDDVEAELEQMWASLLGTQDIGVHDDFFELGGHSLIAVRLFLQDSIGVWR